MTELGQRPNLPSAEDLRIMNVAKMTPDQLLQLCAGTRNPDGKDAIYLYIEIIDQPLHICSSQPTTVFKRFKTNKYTMK